MTAPAVQSKQRDIALARHAELEAIVAKHGVITPELVVKQAKKKASALHALFEWDDTEAARRFRLVQAAMYIRAQARIVRPEGSDSPMRVRAFISLASKRGTGEYHPLAVVVDDDAMRAEMIGNALSDYQKFKQKWQHLSELERLFAVVDPEIDRLLES